MDETKILRSRNSSNTLRVNKVAFHFQKDRLPPARRFYESELGKLTRPNKKGWAQGRCPFHKSKSGKSFSVNLDSGGFHCFGCPAKGGDIVAFVRLRDGCDFATACKALGCWDDLSEAECLKLAGEAAKRDQAREHAARIKQSERRQRLDLRDEIHALVRIQAETCARLNELQGETTLARENEAEHCWNVLALAFEDQRQTEAEYMLLCGFEAEA